MLWLTMLNRIVSKAIHKRATTFNAHPSVLGNFHRAFATSFLPSAMDTAIGNAYDSAKAMTPTDTKAVKAEEDPRSISPSSISTMVTKNKAFTGTPNVGWTLAKYLGKGMP